MIAIQPSKDLIDVGTSSASVVRSRSRCRSRALSKSDFGSESFEKVTLKRKRCIEPSSFKLEMTRGDGRVSIAPIFLSWAVCRDLPTKFLAVQLPDNLTLPDFKYFADDGRSSMMPVSRIGYLPIIPSSPSNPEVVAKAVAVLQQTADSLHQEYTVITCDLAIYEIILALRSKDPKSYEKVVPRLGGLHIAMNFLGAIGYLMKGSGLEELFSKANILLPGSAKKAMTGKPFYRCVRAHQIVAEALCRMYFEAFEDHCLAFGKDTAVMDHIEKVLSEIDVNSSWGTVTGAISDLQSTLEDFDSFLETSFTSKLWLQYMRMCFILMDFLIAERSGDWWRHLKAASLMIPYMAASGHYKYAECLTLYLREMACAPQKLIEIFKEGLFNVKRTPGSMNCVAPDHALESSLNLEAKQKSGLRGVTLNKAAVAKWTLTLPFCSRVSSSLQSMAGLDGATEFDNNILQSHDKTSSLVDKSVSILEEHIHPFKYDEVPLVNVITFETVDTAIAERIVSAEKIGLDAVEDYLKGNSSAFSKIKVQTMESCLKPTQKTKRTFANPVEELEAVKKVLLNVGKNPGSATDMLKKILQHELLQYSPALFEAQSEGFRLRTGKKSDLINFI